LIFFKTDSPKAQVQFKKDNNKAKPTAKLGQKVTVPKRKAGLPNVACVKVAD
jgi:hypothetical protein